MDILLLILLVLAIAIGAVALNEDKLFKGYNPDAVDRDGDGLVQEGTEWERPTPSVKKKAVKKAAAKKAAPAKKKAKKK